MWDMAVGGLGGVLGCDGHVGVGARRGRKGGMEVGGAEGEGPRGEGE